MIKAAMVKIRNEFPREELRIISQVHDELWVEATDKKLIERTAEIMCNAYTPLNGLIMRCDISYTNNSFSKKELEG